MVLSHHTLHRDIGILNRLVARYRFHRFHNTGRICNENLDLVFGEFNPIGKLLFYLPVTIEFVEKQYKDVPFNVEAPI